jgi:ABC-type multidrug transport system fused ATPase/permease subunit
LQITLHKNSITFFRRAHLHIKPNKFSTTNSNINTKNRHAFIDRSKFLETHAEKSPYGKLIAVCVFNYRLYINMFLIIIYKSQWARYYSINNGNNLAKVGDNDPTKAGDNYLTKAGDNDLAEADPSITKSAFIDVSDIVHDPKVKAEVTHRILDICMWLNEQKNIGNERLNDKRTRDVEEKNKEIKKLLKEGREKLLNENCSLIDTWSKEGKKLDKIEGHVEFIDVHFRYPTRPHVPVLRGLNIKVKPGQFAALVGASGCGKSTTVGLTERYYDITSGRIEIDGINIKTININDLRVS